MSRQYRGFDPRDRDQVRERLTASTDGATRAAAEPPTVKAAAQAKPAENGAKPSEQAAEPSEMPSAPPGAYQPRLWEQSVTVAHFETSSKTSLLVEKHWRKGRAYVEVKSFHRREGFSGYFAGRSIVVPVEHADELVAALQAAAAVEKPRF